MIVVSFWAAPYECLIGCCIIMTGIPAYLLGYKWKKPLSIKRVLGEMTDPLSPTALLCLSTFFCYLFCIFMLYYKVR